MQLNAEIDLKELSVTIFLNPIEHALMPCVFTK